MLGMLVVILGGHRISGTARVARQLHVLLRDVRCGTADLDVGSVGLKHPGHRVLAAPVVIIVAVIVVIVVSVTHPLVVVLTVSHVVPLFQPEVTSLEVESLKSKAYYRCHRRFARSGTPQASRITAQFNSRQIFRTSRSTRTRSPTAQADAADGINYSACQNKHRFLA